MKKSHACLIALTCLMGKGFSQDQLFKKDNTRLQVKVLEINPDEIKYKLYNNLTGPTYTENKNNVSLVIYEDGKHEVISTTAVQPVIIAGAPNTVYVRQEPALSTPDSLIYYRHSNNISINFLNFFNNELGLTYQKEFFKSHFNIIIPVAFGIEKPSVTQSVYFGNRAYNVSYNIDKKLFDVGFGINYYPSLRTNVNYYIGPVFKYMQYYGTQTYNYQIPVTTPGVYPNYTNITVTKRSILNRYTMSITNGLIFRTRSRITTSIYGSLGFKNDVVNDAIVNPTTNQTISPIRNEVSLFFWCGFNVGFNF